MFTPSNSGYNSSSRTKKAWRTSVDNFSISISDYQNQNRRHQHFEYYSGDEILDPKKGSLLEKMRRKRFGKATINTNVRESAEIIADELTIHGLPQAIKAKRWISRVFWLATFIGACIGLIVELEKLYESFASQPTVINLQQTKMDHIELPELSICASQPFNASKLRAVGVNVDITDYMNMATDARFNESIDQIFIDDQLEIRRTMLYSKVNSWREFVDQFSIPCEEFFIKCQMGHMQFNCCDVFENLYTPDQGLCFRDNHRASVFLKQEQPGVNGSLQLLVKTPILLDYWTGGPRWNGITIGLPYFYDPHLSPAGKFMMMQIRPTHYIRFLEPGKTCHVDDYMFARFAEMQAAQTGYGMTLCGIFANVVYMACRTVAEHFVTHSRSLCVKEIYIKLVQSLPNRELMSNYSFLIQETCSTPLCSEWSYDVSVTYGEVNRAWVRSVAGEANDMYEYTLLSLFYPDLMFTEIQEFESVTFENIISSVGGLMGLWIGASVISLVQLVFYILQFIYQRLFDWMSGVDHQ